MNRTEEWGTITELLQESALKEYHGTHEYELRRTRQEHLDDMMTNELTTDQRTSIEEMIVEMMSFHDREADLLYHQGMKDCVWLLKNLGVLA